ncbi:hypothetical protein [Flintibacter sp.]|uniref:hypothetical protein n=1 Tax=Flintibacter sp. TaxID=1918624 RepID=UPI0034A0C280
MKRSGIQVMASLVGLVKPLTGYMSLAVLLGLLGHLCATAITVLDGFVVLYTLGMEQRLSLLTLFLLIGLCTLLRGMLRYGEQTCNHFIAFKLLALLRDRIFAVLRCLCPAKLEGKNKGNLISVITSDIELLEVFYYFINSMVTISALIFIAGARTMVLTTMIKQLQYVNRFNEVFVLSLLILATNLAAKALFSRLAGYRSKHSTKNVKKEGIK